MEHIVPSSCSIQRYVVLCNVEAYHNIAAYAVDLHAVFIGMIGVAAAVCADLCTFAVDTAGSVYSCTPRPF
jgi:hypothetical protein